MLTFADRQQITDLLTRYARHVDFGEWEEWFELYTPDARQLYLIARLETRADFEAMRSRPPEPYRRFQHRNSNVVIDEVPGHDDRAVMHSDLVTLANAANPVRFAATCRDEVRKVNGRWLFSLREHPIEGITYLAPELAAALDEETRERVRHLIVE